MHVCFHGDFRNMPQVPKSHVGFDATKPVFRVSDKARLKLHLSPLSYRD